MRWVVSASLIMSAALPTPAWSQATTPTPETIAALVGVVVILAIYFFPALIAVGNHRRQTVAITVLNLLLGWTIIGWVVALVWACVRDGDAVADKQVWGIAPRGPAPHAKPPHSPAPDRAAVAARGSPIGAEQDAAAQDVERPKSLLLNLIIALPIACVAIAIVGLVAVLVGSAFQH